MKRLPSRPCEYKGYQMRSQLERRIASRLDKFDVKWEYEPQGYKMKDGTCYLPDFYLPDLKIWIEGKGVMNEEDAHKCECFAKENIGHELLLVVFPDGKIDVSGGYLCCGDDTIRLFNEPDFFLSVCSKCGRLHLVSGLMDFSCPYCHFYHGDDGSLFDFSFRFFNFFDSDLKECLGNKRLIERYTSEAAETASPSLTAP